MEEELIKLREDLSGEGSESKRGRRPEEGRGEDTRREGGDKTGGFWGSSPDEL